MDAVMKAATAEREHQERIWWLELSSYFPFALATYLMLYQSYIPGRSLFWNCAGVFLWLSLGYLLLQKFLKPTRREKVVVGCLLTISILTLTCLPEALGLWMSQVAFTDFASKEKAKYDNWLTIPLTPRPAKPFGLGFMHILQCKYEGDGGIYLITTERNSFEKIKYGYAYKPSPQVWAEENSRIRHNFQHLWNEWYTFEEVED